MNIPVNKPVITSVDATVLRERESDLVEGYRRMLAAGQPDGLVRSELLRGQDGTWRIQTTRRDMEALLALRRAGVPHAAQALLDGVGTEHSQTWFVVEDGFDAN
ncbi:MAG: hypothetical protein H7311_00630 [Ramlibacter sp.]|nr:hypothetical protein [Cryobacterium sp.]